MTLREPDFQTPDGSARLYLGDCLDVMCELSDFPDSVITDPVWPNNSIVEFEKYNPSELFKTTSQFFNQAKRAAVHLGCDSDPRMLTHIPLQFFRVSWLRYARPHYKGRLLYGSDVAYLYGEPPKSRPGRHVIPGEVCKVDSHGRITKHPCERSTEHVRWLVNWWSESSVIDPFMGSGTTGVACMELGRKFIGIEIERRYFDISVERI